MLILLLGISVIGTIARQLQEAVSVLWLAFNTVCTVQSVQQSLSILVTLTRWTTMWWIPPSLRQWTPRKCPWPSPRTAVKTIPTIPHLKQSVQSLVLKRTASATEILFSQILMVILQDLILLMAFRLQKFKRRKEEDGVLHVLFDCDIKTCSKHVVIWQGITCHISFMYMYCLSEQT